VVSTRLLNRKLLKKRRIK